jgi:hypothetical protein
MDKTKTHTVTIILVFIMWANLLVFFVYFLPSTALNSKDRVYLSFTRVLLPSVLKYKYILHI